MDARYPNRITIDSGLVWTGLHSLPLLCPVMPSFKGDLSVFSLCGHRADVLCRTLARFVPLPSPSPMTPPCQKFSRTPAVLCPSYIPCWFGRVGNVVVPVSAGSAPLYLVVVCPICSRPISSTAGGSPVVVCGVNRY